MKKDKTSKKRQKLALIGSKLIMQGLNDLDRAKRKRLNRNYSDQKILRIACELIQAYNRRKNFGDWVPSANNDVLKKLNSLAYVCKGNMTRLTSKTK